MHQTRMSVKSQLLTSKPKMSSTEIVDLGFPDMAFFATVDVLTWETSQSNVFEYNSCNT